MKYIVSIAEINIAKSLSLVINYTRFVYAIDFSNQWTFLANTLKENLPTLTIAKVGSMKVNNLFLSNVAVNDVLNIPETFNYNNETKLLIFHLADNVNPFVIGLFNLSVGDIILSYWSNKPIDFIEGLSMYNTLVYVPQITQEKDLALSGSQAYQPIAVKLANNNGRYNSFTKDNNVAGNLLKLYSYCNEIKPTLFSQFNNYGVGYIASAKTGNELSLSAQDYRKNLNQILPARKIDSDWFDYISDSNAEAYIPQPWGKPQKCHLICVNSTDTITTEYEFIVADISQLNIDSVNKVYIDNIEVSATITPVIDVTKLIYTIKIPKTAFIVDSSVVNLDKVSADIYGYVDTEDTIIENALDILKHILRLYCNLPFNSSYFDTEAWNIASAKAFRIGLFIQKPQEIKDIIPFINQSIFGFFRWLPNNKVSYLITDFSQIPGINLTKERINNYLDTEVEELYEETYAEAIIGWAKNWSDETARYFGYPDTTDLAEVLTPEYITENYSTNKVADLLDTLLVYKEDVNNFYSDLMQQIGFVPKKVDIEVAYSNEHNSIDIGQIINCEINRIGWAKVEVISKKVQLHKLLINFTFRIIDYIESPIADITGTVPFYNSSTYNESYYTKE